MDLRVDLKMKYDCHVLLRLNDPGITLDFGSMDGSNSKRFRMRLPDAEIVEYGGNSCTYPGMLEYPERPSDTDGAMLEEARLGVTI